jgi:hypothetical protein
VENLKISNLLKYLACASPLWLGSYVTADSVPVRHVEGFIHGYIVLKDMDDAILASGDVTQSAAGNHVTTVMSLHFKDGSLYEETSSYSQEHAFRLLNYKQVMKGPVFKTQQTMTIDAGTGNVSIKATEKDGKEKTISKQMSLPEDLANGIVSTLLSDLDPKVETTVSMLAASPEPRLVKLKISAAGEDPFSIGGVGFKATHYVVKVDLGPVTGTAAKVIGKQPPPTDTWVAAGAAPIFLKSQGQLFENGPIWRIELASPSWPKAPQGK